MFGRVDRCSRWVFRQRAWVIAIIQAVAIACAFALAFLLRFDFSIKGYGSVLLETLPLVVAVRLSVFAYFKLMRGWWRFAGMSDALDIGKAVAIGTTINVAILRGIARSSCPLSVLAIEAVLTWIITGGLRFASRVFAESVLSNQTARRILLIGAGNAAQMVIRETRTVATGYVVVGCLDDDPRKKGTKLHGVPVFGTIDEVASTVCEHGIEEMLIAIPSATPAQMKRIVHLCQQTGLIFKTVPGIRELISGQPTIQQIREVRLEELLGRDPVKMDLQSVREQLQGRSVLVTGAAGSIGSELCRQILRYEPNLLVCVDQNENGIFFLERQLTTLRKENTNLIFCVADIGDQARMSKVLQANPVTIVFHAAAYKHVPVMEANVQEAVDNNIFGLLKLLTVSQSNGVHDFVLISSDKAVNPTNVMGATKRICELVISAWPDEQMRCVSVRFGNVLGSAGSVVPIFQEQLRRNLPITITHPEIKRYFMTIPEAVSLVLQAFGVGKHRDILVLDMGEPVRIRDLADSLIRLSGKAPNTVEIKYTGLRPGEKLYEELFYETEEISATECDKVKRTQSARTPWSELNAHLEQLRHSMSIDGAAPVRKKLNQIVDEYRPVKGANFDLIPNLKASAKTVSIN